MQRQRESTLHPVDLAVVVTYVGLITYVGIRFSQRVKTAKDFFLAGRSLAWWVIGLSIIGTNVDTNGYIGASGNAYSIGIAQANFEWIGAIPAMIIAALIFIPLYWRAGVYSIAEYLGLRYNQAPRMSGSDGAGGETSGGEERVGRVVGLVGRGREGARTGRQ